MANQRSNDRTDRNGGGDVTKSERVATPSPDKTVRSDYAGSRGSEDSGALGNEE